MGHGQLSGRADGPREARHLDGLQADAALPPHHGLGGHAHRLLHRPALRARPLQLHGAQQLGQRGALLAGRQHHHHGRVRQEGGWGGLICLSVRPPTPQPAEPPQRGCAPNPSNEVLHGACAGCQIVFYDGKTGLATGEVVDAHGGRSASEPASQPESPCYRAPEHACLSLQPVLTQLAQHVDDAFLLLWGGSCLWVGGQVRCTRWPSARTAPSSSPPRLTRRSRSPLAAT